MILSDKLTNVEARDESTMSRARGWPVCEQAQCNTCQPEESTLQTAKAAVKAAGSEVARNTSAEIDSERVKPEGCQSSPNKVYISSAFSTPHGKEKAMPPPIRGSSRGLYGKPTTSPERVDGLRGDGLIQQL